LAVRDLPVAGYHATLLVPRRRVRCDRCGGVRTERLEWLAANPRYTARFARAVGRRCRSSPVRDVADEFRVHWHTIKDLDIDYMAEQLAAAGPPDPTVLGIDEIAIAARHQYRIVVSDLTRRRPIWFGGTDRSEASLDTFYQWLGPEKSGQIRLVVMDMWKAFRASTLAPGHAPQATIIYDKFHILRHLGEAMDRVRKQEYARLTGDDRGYLKGQKFVLLSNWDNLTRDKRRALDELFAVNRRLCKAYLLKESFGQLWDYRRPAWARHFFDRWRQSLRWQRLPSFEKFARLVERHWDGIEAYCHAENKVALGFVESLNHSIRQLQRRACGYRDEEYFRLKILTHKLPKL
jgi:transposase